MNPTGAGVPAAPPCLLRLGLTGDADLRAVRRAYAVELKQIDQQSETRRFQQLREDYEAALQWLYDRHGEGTAPPAVTAGSAPHSGADPGPGASDLLTDPSQRAFADFQSGSEILIGGPHHDVHQAWQALLNACLDHEDLINMEARAVFQERIGRLLAQGWRPGHDRLFPAAIEAFGWAGNQRQFDSMGHDGAFLNRAIHELAMYDNQDDVAHASQERLRERLRGTRPPDAGLLENDMRQLTWMLDCFPNWTAIVLNPARIAQWQSAYSQHGIKVHSYVQRVGHIEWQFDNNVPPTIDVGDQWRRPNDAKKPEGSGDKKGKSQNAEWDNSVPFVPRDGYRLASQALAWVITLFILVIVLNVLRIMIFET